MLDIKPNGKTMDAAELGNLLKVAIDAEAETSRLRTVRDDANENLCISETRTLNAWNAYHKALVAESKNYRVFGRSDLGELVAPRKWAGVGERVDARA